jgi:hypothetical protein
MKKLLALLLLFGIVGCSQSELERCVDANSRFKELTLNFFMNEHSEQDLIPDVILNLDLIGDAKLDKEFIDAYVELHLKNFPATEQNIDYVRDCLIYLGEKCTIEGRIKEYNASWSSDNQNRHKAGQMYLLDELTNKEFNRTFARLLEWYTASELTLKRQMEREDIPNSTNTIFYDATLLTKEYFKKLINKNIETHNVYISELTTELNDKARKEDRLNATGICNAQGIY